MKIRSVVCNNRKKAFQVKSSKGTLLLPYSKVEVRPSGNDPVARVFVDKELRLTVENRGQRTILLTANQR